MKKLEVQTEPGDKSITGRLRLVRFLTRISKKDGSRATLGVSLYPLKQSQV